MSVKWDQFLKDSGLKESSDYTKEQIVSGKRSLSALDSVFYDDDFLMDLAIKRPSAIMQNTELLTPQLVKAMLESDPSIVRLIPKEFLTRSNIEAALKFDPKVIRFLDVSLLDDELCELVAKDEKLGVKLIKDVALRNKLAIKNPQHGMVAVENSKVSEQTEAFLLEAASKSYGQIKCASQITEHMNSNLLTDSVMSKFISMNPDAYASLPKVLKTPRVSHVAVAQGFSGLELVPVDHITEKVAFNAVYSDPNNVRFVPCEFITQELCNYAAENAAGKLQLKNIPAEFRTKNVCLLSLEWVYNKVPNFMEIPDELKADYDFLISVAKVSEKLLPQIKEIMEQ